jgi:hypothetical protein
VVREDDLGGHCSAPFWTCFQTSSQQIVLEYETQKHTSCFSHQLPCSCFSPANHVINAAVARQDYKNNPFVSSLGWNQKMSHEMIEKFVKKLTVD